MVESNKISLKGDGLAFIKMSNKKGINKHKQAKNKQSKFNNYPI